jgi:hypothetical protein
VVQVQHHPQARSADRLDQRQGVGGAGERHAGVVDGGVEVLQAEGHPGPLPKGGHPLQGARRGQPHGAGDLLHRPHRQPLGVQPGAVQVEPRAAQPPGHGDRLLGRGQQLGGTVVVGQGAGDVAGHGREHGARLHQGVEVLAGPVPDLDLESQVGDPPDPFADRQLEEHHLGADGQLDRPRSHRRPGLLLWVHVLGSLLHGGCRWLV